MLVPPENKAEAEAEVQKLIVALEYAEGIIRSNDPGVADSEEEKVALNAEATAAWAVLRPLKRLIEASRRVNSL